jgi:hypothetical protein
MCVGAQGWQHVMALQETRDTNDGEEIPYMTLEQNMITI